MVELVGGEEEAAVEKEVEPPTATTATAATRQRAGWRRPWRRRCGPSRPASRRLSFLKELYASRAMLGARFAGVEGEREIEKRQLKKY